MGAKTATEKSLWEEVTHLLRVKEKGLGPVSSSCFFTEPQEMARVLSHCKFIAKMACKDRNLLELGCGEAVGSSILSEEAEQYLGVDSPGEQIEFACLNWTNQKRSFIPDTYLGKHFGSFDTIITLDAHEKISEELENAFFDTVQKNLSPHGLCACSLKNEAERYPGFVHHMKEIFHNLLPFSTYGESIRGGLHDSAEYFILLGCYRRP